MRLSMWSGFLNGLDLEIMVQTFFRHGWTELELSSEHAQNLLEKGNPEKTGAEFRKFAEGEGVHFSQGHLLPKLPFGAIDRRECDAAVEKVLPWCDLFNALEIKAGVLHVGGTEDMRRDKDENALFEARVESIRQILEFTKGSNLTICLENISIPYAKTADDLLALIADFSSDAVGICLDTGHLIIHAPENERDNAVFIRKVGASLKALHINENLGKGDDHLFPFTKKGLVEWRAVMQSLKEIDYQGLFNFEVPGESINTPMELRFHKLDYARQLGEFLLSLINQKC